TNDIDQTGFADTLLQRVFRLTVLCSFIFIASGAFANPVELGHRRELFVDNFLLASKTNVQFALHEPHDEGAVLPFDAPWEGAFCAYCTVLYNENGFRVYYRGKGDSTADGVGEVTCVAESNDGKKWTKPKLGFFEIAGSKENNVVLTEAPFTHNFSPFLDSNPDVRAGEKYKAICGDQKAGLKIFASPEGLRWKPMPDKPVLTTNDVAFKNMFDSQNVAFWSQTENCYLLYFRVYTNRFRRIARAESKDFFKWNNIRLMDYRSAGALPTPIEHLYTSQTHPYFRAPQIYVALAARFMLGRQVLTADEAKAIGVHPKYFKDISDAVLLTSRGGDIYDRTFMSAFIKPGIGPENWVSRTTYPALNEVQTGPTEMSIYVNQNYAQPTAHLRRYSLRLDGYSSLRATYEGGEFVTRPLTFSGNRLLLNFSTSAAGGIKIAIWDANGTPVPGFTFKDSVESIGNEIERAARWKNGPDISKLAGQTVQLHFKMKDADLFAIQFADK
ncbi:MAG: hypothetical protein JWO95_3639, partial [Verrucomicrobiales bacterium]|nr:hypothetical protein [Verrucomicrobiales bacterium]